jgi:hypothetical protein
MTERVQDGAAVGVAFVGCSHPHIVPRLQVLAVTPGACLVGGYDPDAALSGALQERFGLRPFPSAGALLDQPDVGLAIVEGWDEDNPGYAREALYRERAVLLEKPGASASLSPSGGPAIGGGAPASTWPVTHSQIAWPPIGPAREGT